jgi:hypothetical protein
MSPIILSDEFPRATSHEFRPQSASGCDAILANDGLEAKDMRKKRKLFDELMEGFDALVNQRTGKQTLRTHTPKPKSVPRKDRKKI